MTATEALSLVCVVLGCLLTATFASVGFLIRSYLTRMRERDNTLTRLATQIELMNQGASVGAQNLFRELRGRVDILETAYDAHDDRLNHHDTQLAVITDRIDGHIRTPATYAHPPAVAS